MFYRVVVCLYIPPKKLKYIVFIWQRWLSRTPGLEADGFNFWDKYKTAVIRYLDDAYRVPAMVSTKSCSNIKMIW